VDRSTADLRSTLGIIDFGRQCGLVQSVTKIETWDAHAACLDVLAAHNALSLLKAQLRLEEGIGRARPRAQFRRLHKIS
jgi:hypothetical protein